MATGLSWRCAIVPLCLCSNFYVPVLAADEPTMFNRMFFSVLGVRFLVDSPARAHTAADSHAGNTLARTHAHTQKCTRAYTRTCTQLRAHTFFWHFSIHSARLFGAWPCSMRPPSTAKSVPGGLHQYCPEALQTISERWRVHRPKLYCARPLRWTYTSGCVILLWTHELRTTRSSLITTISWTCTASECIARPTMSLDCLTIFGSTSRPNKAPSYGSSASSLLIRMALIGDGLASSA